MSDNWEDTKRAAQMSLEQAQVEQEKVSYAETLVAAKPRIVEVIKVAEQAVVDMEKDLGEEGLTFPRLLTDIRDVTQALEAEGPQIDSNTRAEEAGQEKGQEAATLVSLKPRLLRVLDGTESVIRRMSKEYGYDNWPVREDIQEVVDVIAPERKQELEQLIQEHIERGREPERLKAINAELLGENEQLKALNTELLEALKTVSDQMSHYDRLVEISTQDDPPEFYEEWSAVLRNVDEAIAKATMKQQEREPTSPEPERDRDIEPEM